MPHGHCYLWRPGLIWLNVISDGSISAAYTTIPIALVYFKKNRKDLPFSWIFLWFGIFIIACGATHMMDIWTLWTPTYWLAGVIKAITAAASVPTAYLLIKAVPKALKIPNPTQANLAIRQSEARFRGLLEAAPDAMVIVNEEGRIELINQRVEDWFGYERSELVGKPLELLMPERFREPHLRHRLRYFQAPKKRPMGAGLELFARRKDGSEFPVDISISPMRSEHGTLVMASVRDISQRKKLEYQLRFQLSVSRAMAESIDYNTGLNRLVALIVPEVADWCAVVSTQDSAALKLECVAHRDSSKIPLFEELMREYVPNPKAARGLEHAITTGKSVLIPAVTDALWEIAGPNEHLRDKIDLLGFEAYVIIPLNAHGRRLGALIMGQGESHRRFDAEDLPFYEGLSYRAALSIDKARLFQEAQSAIHSRENILAVVSHDLKNPISAISLNAELLSALPSIDDTTRTQVNKICQNVTQSVRLMNQLVGDILDLAKIQEKRLRIQPKKQEVGPAVYDCTEMMKAAAGLKSQKIVIDLDSAVPLLSFDRVRFNQVMLNLLSNAIKFTPPTGTITVQSKRLDREVQFSVSDTGPGIPAECRAHLFERFWQAKETASQGVGLGLSIAKGLVEAHGGQIWVETADGKGSTFLFTLPIDRSESLESGDVKSA